MRVKSEGYSSPESVTLAGIGASAGKAEGPIHRLQASAVLPGLAPSEFPSAARDPESEEALLRDSIERVATELSRQAEALSGDAGGILEAQRIMLADPMLVDVAIGYIHADRRRADEAISEAAAEAAAILESIDDEYIRRRSADVRDVAQRVVRAIRAQTFPATPAGSVLLARDVNPSELIEHRNRGAVALAIEGGAANSHTAILARALKLPLVVGVDRLNELSSGFSWAEVDGSAGVVKLFAVPPSDDAAARPTSKTTAIHGRPRPELRTSDGRRVRLYANLGRPDELDLAIDAGAEGIGVLRTEFLFLDVAPSEDRQYETYRLLAEKLAGRPLIIRTLDAGGDKPLPYLEAPREANPFLGLRGIRLSLALANREVFRTQLRAILRASRHGRVALMYPMVTDLADLEQANGELSTCRQELAISTGLEIPAIEQGAMIEVPAAAICADRIARSASFLSIGTNDLAQYALAADRANPHVAAFYSQRHLAVMRLIKMTVDGARAHGRPVAVCGEVASDFEAISLLIGLGVEELSVSPYTLEDTRAAVEKVDYSEAARFAANFLG